MKCALLLVLFLLIGCSSDEAKLSSISGVGNGSPIDTSSYYPVSFTVSNLGVAPLVMSLNDESQYLVTSDGTYTFNQKVKPGSEFEVRIGGDPADRNCVVVNPVQYATGPSSVSIKCAPSTHNYYGGFVSGLSVNGLVLRLTASGGTTEDVTLTAGATKWNSQYPYAISLVSISISTQPAGLYCTFSTGSMLATMSAGNFEYPVVCIPDFQPTYTLQIQISGLSGGSVDIVSGNTYQTYAANGTGIFATVNQNTRQLLEIINTPPGQRCYFNQTKNHIYSELITSAFDHTIQVTCTARAPCETSGVELPSVNGTLNDIECVNDKFVYGGKFTSIGRQLGIAKVITGATVPTPVNHTWDRIHGQVHDIINDGSTGIYAVGDFDKVGDLHKKNIVHMNFNLMANEKFNIDTNGPIYKVIKSQNKIYIFGDFTQVIQNGTVYSRDGFAKIDHSSETPVVTNLTLPTGLRVKPTTGFSAQMFDTTIYAHGSFLVNGVQRNLSIKMNRSSGTTTYVTSSLTELSKTLYWQEPNTTKVWLLNSDVGIVDPMTFNSHPFDTSHLYVPLNHDYTIMPLSNLLFSSNGSKVKQTDLNSIYNGTAAIASDWGRDSASNPADILNAGHGYVTSANVCFFQKAGTAEIIAGNPGVAANKKKGIACFGPTGTLMGFNPGNILGVSKAYVSSSNTILNTVHFVQQKTNALAMANGDSSFYSFTSGMNESDEVVTIANDDPEVYIGGSFSSLPGCGTCTNIGRISIAGVPTINTAWTFSIPFTQPVKKLSQQGGILVGISEVPSRRLFGLDLTGGTASATFENLPATPLDVANIGDSMIVRQVDRITFHEQVTLGGTAPLNTFMGSSPVARTNVRLVSALNSPILSLHDLDGNLDSDITVSPFVSSTLQIATIADRPCLYSGGTAVYCTDEGGVLKLSKSIPDENFTFFKGVKNAAILGKGKSAPVVLVPDP